MNHKTHDFRHSYCPEYPFWLYVPDGDGMTFWKTEEERNRYAEEEIQSYLQDGEWSEEVQYVCAGVVGYSAQECDVLRPKGEIDEEGYDEDGEGRWESEDDIRCNYRLQPLFGALS